MFRNLHFELSFADALLHMPKFAPMFRKLLNNKDKIIDLIKTPVNENCSNRYPQKDKNKAKTRQNRARDWKERGKPKPKAYTS
ncbi:hypothetical protein Tco_0228645 [Tanacetum coccineum]